MSSLKSDEGDKPPNQHKVCVFSFKYESRTLPCLYSLLSPLLSFSLDPSYFLKHLARLCSQTRSFALINVHAIFPSTSAHSLKELEGHRVT